MPHYPIEQWVDYSRGLADPARRTAMQAHLASGCDACSALLQLVSRFSNQMKQEAELDKLTQPLARQAAAIFALPKLDSSIWSRLAATLIYDSRLDPVPAGTRSGNAQARHLLFSAGPYRIDLSAEKRAQGLSIVGQILHEQPTSSTSEPLAIQLLSGQRILLDNQTNEFGEFTFACHPQPRLRLQISIPAHPTYIDIDLKSLAGKDPDDD